MTTAGDVLALARADDGYAEDPPGSNRTKFGAWYGLDGQPWCAMALSKWFYDAGLPLPASTSKGFAWTPAGADWFRRQGRWLGSTDRRVTPGLVVFFYWPSLRRIGHVGIVDEVLPDGTFWSWEGNTDEAGGRTGGRVIRQHRSRATVGSGGGFGIPTYSAPQEEDEMTPEQAADLIAIKNYVVDAQARLVAVEGKARDAVNYAVDAQERLVAIEEKVDALRPDYPA